MGLSIKGLCRQYRKACRRIGVLFPHRGTFHVQLVSGGVVQPADMVVGLRYKIVIGLAPVAAVVAPPVPYINLPLDNPLQEEDTLPACYKRIERVGKDGENTKKRVDYRLVKNPKAGERYFVKSTEGGKNRYVEVDFSQLLKAEVA